MNESNSTAGASSVNLNDLGIHPSWHQVFEPLQEQLCYLLTAVAAAKDAGEEILPDDANIFKAFSYPFDQVKVLIIGQDPYPTPGDAMGLSFSVNPGRAIPRSLKNIYTELHADLGIPPVTHGDLRPWAEQGVCLLNTVLTVRAGQAASHRTLGWQIITTAAITALNARKQPLVAILWGKDAQRMAANLGDTAIISSAHPSPLSASRGFLGSQPFSRTNELLRRAGAPTIHWQLPASYSSDAAAAVDPHSGVQTSLEL
ncbi:MAG: uracil-DNA glycosylase [Corynebacterium sp.]|nr:uracil-DNA glycosylase [Corynebacterium sp.]